MALLFESIKVIHYPTAEESGSIFQCRFINNHFGTFCLDALHDTLNGTLTEVIRVGLHGEAIHTDYATVLLTCIVIAILIVSIVTGFFNTASAM